MQKMVRSLRKCYRLCHFDKFLIKITKANEGLYSIASAILSFDIFDMSIFDFCNLFIWLAIGAKCVEIGSQTKIWLAK